MARGNPNFKKEKEVKSVDQEVIKSEKSQSLLAENAQLKRKIEILNDKVNDQLYDFDKLSKGVEITDQTIIDDFDKLATDLTEMQKIKAAKQRPSRHYFAISQQVQMWGRNFLRSCDPELKSKVKFGK